MGPFTYIPGRFLTGSRPLSTVICPASYPVSSATAEDSATDASRGLLWDGENASLVPMVNKATSPSR